MRVLLVLDHAPDYREAFLRHIGSLVQLTVIAAPSSEVVGLRSPTERKGYRYIETATKQHFGLFWQPGLYHILKLPEWDVCCVDINLRHLSRLIAFVFQRVNRRRWAWWGMVYGRSQSWATRKVRGWLLRRGAAILVYSQAVVERLQRDYQITSVAFNNSEVEAKDFRRGSYPLEGPIRLLFVGRNTPRKRLDRLVQIVNRRRDVCARIIGPGSERLDVPQKHESEHRIVRMGYLSSSELDEHFDWADLVVSPGHVGLMVTAAARHAKGIVIDRDSRHAPEYQLAKDANQPFISFSDENEVDAFLDHLKDRRGRARELGEALQEVARSNYTVENMAKMHYEVFSSITDLEANK